LHAFLAHWTLLSAPLVLQLNGQHVVASSVHKTCERKIQEETEETSVCERDSHTQRERVRETKERRRERNMYTYMQREERV